MLMGFSEKLREDAHRKVQEALRACETVNLIRLSEEIRLKNLDQNIAREDIESLVMQVAQLYGAAIEFDEQALTALDCPADSRDDLEKVLGGRTGQDASVDLIQ